MSLHLDVESCDLHIEADGSLSVVAREGRLVVAGYSADGFYREMGVDWPLSVVVRRELEKALWFAGKRHG